MKNVEEFKMQIGETLESYKQSLTGNSDGGSGDQRGDRKMLTLKAKLMGF